jgi:RimJ/RimL family protein N-acetyltransferase
MDYRKKFPRSVIVPLRDGRRVEIRAQTPQDIDGLRVAINRMSDESLYSRFFGMKREFSEKEIEYFLNIDFVSHVALVAMSNQDDNRSIIGGGRYIIIEPGRAEVAFAVVDEYQGQGVGAALMRELAAVANQAGLAELIAEVLASNAAMLRVFEKSGLKMNVKYEGPLPTASALTPRSGVLRRSAGASAWRSARGR